MALQYKFFTIPIKVADKAETELDRFPRSVSVITVHREFVSHGENSFWGIAVEYITDGYASQPPGSPQSPVWAAYLQQAGPATDNGQLTTDEL